MSVYLMMQITVFVLAVFVGFEVISKVPSMLHTPLMSATNAIHGIVVVGAMLIAGAAIGGVAGHAIGLAAMILGSINVVGGFAVTERMLEMFKGRTENRPR
ncbi:MAG TPA: NAD(P) transhydrogenase subunit alpha [Candidatus Eremiobacteraceae bacterium]|nr:NAD(P) transhydrogenase subunit alpha [Candidatus Eremiobacteraceae bacterium]